MSLCDNRNKRKTCARAHTRQFARLMRYWELMLRKKISTKNYTNEKWQITGKRVFCFCISHPGVLAFGQSKRNVLFLYAHALHRNQSHNVLNAVYRLVERIVHFLPNDARKVATAIRFKRRHSHTNGTFMPWENSCRSFTCALTLLTGNSIDSSAAFGFYYFRK